MEKISVKRINKIEIAELVYDPIFFLENKKKFLQVKVSLFSQLTVFELIPSKLWAWKSHFILKESFYNSNINITTLGSRITFT